MSLVSVESENHDGHDTVYMYAQRDSAFGESLPTFE